MNRFAKGAIAGAAGIILLLSGAGSFALWNGTAYGAGGTVQSGTMTIDTVGQTIGTWSVTHGGVTTPNVSIASFRAVPGDTLTFTQTVNVSATGNNLTALLSVDPASVKPSSSNPVAPADAALAAALTSGMTVSLVGTPPAGVTAAGTNTYQVLGTVGKNVPVTVAVSLPFDPTTAGAIAQGGSVNLSKLAFTLTQQ